MREGGKKRYTFGSFREWGVVWRCGGMQLKLWEAIPAKVCVCLLSQVSLNTDVCDHWCARQSPPLTAAASALASSAYENQGHGCQCLTTWQQLQHIPTWQVCLVQMNKAVLFVVIQMGLGTETCWFELDHCVILTCPTVAHCPQELLLTATALTRYTAFWPPLLDDGNNI